MADFHQTNRFGAKTLLLFPKDFTDASLPKVPAHRGRVRFAADHDPDHGLFFQRLTARVVSLGDPQIKKLSSSELPFLDEMFEGCLPADPLIRAEPLSGFQLLAPCRINWGENTEQRRVPQDP